MQEDEILVTEEENKEAPKPFFTVKTVLNAAMEQEASLALAPKFSKYFTYGCFILSGILTVGMFASYFWDHQSQSLILGVVMLLLLAFLIYNHLTTPKKMLRRWEASMERAYGTAELHLTTEFFDHSLAQSVEETNDITVTGYSELSGIKDSEHLLLLRRDRSHWFFLARDGVQNGALEDLRAFLEKKMGD